MAASRIWRKRLKSVLPLVWDLEAVRVILPFTNCHPVYDNDGGVIDRMTALGVTAFWGDSVLG